MKLIYLRWSVGVALSAYAVALFFMNISHDGDLAGPFFLFMVGLAIVAGRCRLSAAIRSRRASESDLMQDANIRAFNVKARWVERIGFAVFAVGVLCWILDIGVRSGCGWSSR